MPLGKKDRQMKASFEKRYGDRGEEVYYRTLNKAVSRGKPINTPEGKRMADKRKHKRKSTRRSGR